MPNNYIIANGELYHHGIKGMKWGRRRYQNADGSLTPAGVKRYAKAGYAQDSYNSNKTRAGKIYDKVTGSHGINADVKYAKATKKQREARAKQYLADKEIRDKENKQKAKERTAKAIVKGAQVASKLATASLVDDIFYGGAGKKIAKEAVIQTGRAAITAYTMARGGYDIKWYDKHGRRVG